MLSHAAITHKSDSVLCWVLNECLVAEETGLFFSQTDDSVRQVDSRALAKKLLHLGTSRTI